MTEPPDKQDASEQVAGQTSRVAVKIQNKLGLHARPAMSFVDLANVFTSNIQVQKGDQVVDGKSIMQMMMLAATQGTELMIQASGSDAEASTTALTDLVNRKFDEE